MFFIRLFLSFIFISNILAEPLPDLHLLYTEPILYISKSLRLIIDHYKLSRIQDIDIPLKIKEYVSSLSYPERLHNKLIHFLIEEFSQSNTKYNILKNVYKIEFGVASLFDFIYCAVKPRPSGRGCKAQSKCHNTPPHSLCLILSV